MPECHLVPKPGRCQVQNRPVAKRIQLRAASQQPGVPHASRVRRSLEILNDDWLSKSRHVTRISGQKIHRRSLAARPAELRDRTHPALTSRTRRVERSKRPRWLVTLFWDL